MNKIDIDVIKSDKLSKEYEPRYIVVKKDTKEVLDDAQGYGFKDKRSAYACWSYKNRDKSKDKEIKKIKREIKKWLEAEGKWFISLYDAYVLDCYKTNEKVLLTSKMFIKCCEENRVDVGRLKFSVKDFIKYFLKV